jgi:membrane-associated phospholipid phosphatase
MDGYRRFVLSLCGVCTLLSTAGAVAAPPLSDRQEDVRGAGDKLQYAIPLTGLAMTFVFSAHRGPESMDLTAGDLLHLNGSPRHDLLLALGRSSLVTEALKAGVNERRPNGGHNSFPSGHTSFAFTGAEFIRKEYGWRWGAPAYLAASFVGWSRVEAQAHHTHDVLAGAAIGILANHDFGEMKTRFGRLSLGSDALQTPVAVVPGLKLELSF